MNRREDFNMTAEVEGQSSGYNITVHIPRSSTSCSVATVQDTHIVGLGPRLVYGSYATPIYGRYALPDARDVRQIRPT